MTIPTEVLEGQQFDNDTAVSYTHLDVYKRQHTVKEVNTTLRNQRYLETVFHKCQVLASITLCHKEVLLEFVILFSKHF